MYKNENQYTLYNKIILEILKLIIDRNIKPNELLPSEGKLAEIYGVSKMTTKLALNKLAEKNIIYRLPRRGSFLADVDLNTVEELLNSSSKNEANDNTSKFIALIIPTLDMYTSGIIKGIEELARKNNIHVIIKCTAGKSEIEGEILSEIEQMPEIKGVILYPNDDGVCGNNLLKLKMQNYPIVIIDRLFKEIKFDSVYHNNFQGAKIAINYLIKKGHNNIGFLSDDISHITSREERYLGFVNAMMESNKGVKNEYIQIGKDLLTNENISNFLLINNDMTAVFCTDDYTAIRLYYVAEKLNKTMPKDLSIIGFTDNPILEYMPFELTSVRQPVTELCEKAFNTLINKIENPDAPIQTSIIETVIIERSSVYQLI